MANSFKNASVDPIGTTATTLYTCPGGTTAIVHSLYIGNKDASNSVNVTVEFYDDNAAATRIIGNELPIPVGGVLVFDKPINLEPGDQIQLTASDASRGTAFASVLEIT